MSLDAHHQSPNVGSKVAVKIDIHDCESSLLSREFYELDELLEEFEAGRPAIDKLRMTHLDVTRNVIGDTLSGLIKERGRGIDGSADSLVGRQMQRKLLAVWLLGFPLNFGSRCIWAGLGMSSPEPANFLRW